MKTYMAHAETVERKWYVVDAAGVTLGRLATRVASVLRGKHKPTYTPNVDTGDFVIVINTDKVVLTGNKLEDKMYRYHTGYIGNLKEIPYKKLMAEKSDLAVYDEDIAIMRAIPGMVVINPADYVEAQEAVKAAIEHEGPVYLRFGRANVPVINDREDYKFEIGKGVVVREGKDVTIVATGIMVNSALEAAEKLAEEGIDAEVLNIHTIKPLDEELVVASAKKTGKVVTAEEHSVIGGLGSAVCDCLCAKYPTPVYKIGMQDVFGESGSAADLMVKYEIDGAGVYKQVKEFLAKF